MERSLVLYLGILAFLTTSCSAGSWSDEDKQKFMNECKAEGGGSSYCECYLEKVMDKYPNYADSEKLDFETAVEFSDQCD